MPAKRKPVRSLLLRSLLTVLKPYIGSKTWKRAQASGRWLGSVLWRANRRDRDRSIEHLRIAFPEIPESEQHAIALRAAQGLGINLAELLYLAHRGWQHAKSHLEIRGWQYVRDAHNESPAILIASGHCGNWELLGPAFRQQGEALTAIVRTMQERWMESAVSRFRQQLGSESIARGEPGAAARLLSLRRNGGTLLTLVDQDIRANSVWVPFFGRPAHTPVGPAEMALRWNMPVLTAFDRRLADGSHVIEFRPPIEERANETVLTAAMTRAVESHVREVPDQWVWSHRRWRRQPDQSERRAQVRGRG